MVAAGRVGVSDECAQLGQAIGRHVKRRDCRSARGRADCRTIVRVAERLPPSVLQEDAGLLMYYDNALLRAFEPPRRQERQD